MALATPTLKRYFLILNLIIVVIGVFIIGYSIYAIYNGIEYVVPNDFITLGYLYVVLNIILVAIAGFGLKIEKIKLRNKLIIYIIALAVLIFLQLLHMLWGMHDSDRIGYMVKTYPGLYDKLGILLPEPTYYAVRLTFMIIQVVAAIFAFKLNSNLKREQLQNTTQYNTELNSINNPVGYTVIIPSNQM